MEEKEKRSIKVVWVHLMFEKRDYFFGSISALYRTLTPRQVGIRQSTLAHKKDSTIITGRAIIKKSRLIR